MNKANISLKKVAIPHDALVDFCLRNRIRRLSLFGSVLRDDFGPNSDVDVLVEFEPGTRVGLIGLAGMEIELSNLLGHKVDLRTPADLSRYFREEVMQSAEVQYAQRWSDPHPNMLDAAREAMSFVQGHGRSELDQHRMLTLALVKAIEIIGEAASQVSTEARGEHPEIPWANIVGMRNRLIHAYFDVNLDILWNTAIDDLPPLAANLEKIVQAHET